MAFLENSHFKIICGQTMLWVHFKTLPFFNQYTRIHFKLSTNMKKNIYKNIASWEVSQPIRKELSDWLALQSTIKEAVFGMLIPFLNKLQKCLDHLKLLSERFFEQSSLWVNLALTHLFAIAGWLFLVRFFSRCRTKDLWWSMIKNFVPAFRSYRNYAPSQWVEILSYGGFF